MKKITFITLLLLTSQSFASGLTKPVWVGPKAIGMGGAFVGVADDTTAIFHNPAGISQLQADHNFQLGADTLITNLDYTPPAGTLEKADRSILPVPSFGYVNRQLKMISLGLGVFFPHGNGGEFPSPSAIPTNGNEGRIYSMEISPAVAWQIIPEVSLGASLRVTRISTSLKGPMFVLPGPTIDTLDDLSVDGWGYGMAVGLLAKPTPWLRVGANYRSKITKTLKGDGSFATLGNFDARLKFSLPTLITMGFAAQATKKLLMSFQYDFEKNSEIENFELSSTALGVSGLLLPQNWRDSHTYHFGFLYDVCKTVNLIGGYARDFQNSIPDAATNRITGDIDAHEVSGGLLFKLRRYNAGLAWNGRWGDRDVPATTTNIAPGNYKAFVHTLSANVGLSL
jgi:long-chain fatty acid transport protein